jgi:hypothetical protein
MHPNMQLPFTSRINRFTDKMSEVKNADSKKLKRTKRQKTKRQKTKR